MKVTALLPDELIQQVRQYSGGKNITESLHKALREWVALEKTKELNARIRKRPLRFADGFSARRVRNLNQRQ